MLYNGKFYGVEFSNIYEEVKDSMKNIYLDVFFEAVQPVVLLPTGVLVCIV